MANNLNQKHKGQAQNLLFSTYFLNIDGNKTNFDRLSAELAVIKHKFSVVALAETNTDACNKDLYKLSNEYTPVYSSKIKNKVKGSGVALYVKNDFSFSILNELSSCDKNIETLFIKIANTSAPVIKRALIYLEPAFHFPNMGLSFQFRVLWSFVSRYSEMKGHVAGAEDSPVNRSLTMMPTCRRCIVQP